MINIHEKEIAVLRGLVAKPQFISLVPFSNLDFSTIYARQVFEKISQFQEDHPENIEMITANYLTSEIGGNGANPFLSNLYAGVLSHVTEKQFRETCLDFFINRRREELFRLLDQRKKEHDFIVDDEILRKIEEIKTLGESQSGPTEIMQYLKTGIDLQALELETSWAVEKLVPARSITLLHSPGGLGKTWFSLGLANAVSQGLLFLGLATKQRPVCYIDFENPLPLLIDRARKLDIREVRFWHLSASIPPPKLDTAAHALYRQLPAGSLIVFDTLRAAHDGDENSSQDMALIMGRLKELRELGFDIFLIHHTPKANERLYKGSTAISDLADHVIKLYRSRRGSLEELQDDSEPDPDATFVLATGKTRFEPFHLFLSFNLGAGGFSVAKDPNLDALEALTSYITGPGRGQNQTDILGWMKDNLGSRRIENFIALLRRGEREGRWQSRRGFKGAKLYEPKT
jgi:putative DNA primase/helicase